MGRLEDLRVPTRIKLAGLWASTMFCYIYADYFGLFVPGALTEMNRGILGPLGVGTPGIFLAVSAMMAAPSLTIFLSLALPAAICRWLNLAMGAIYTGIIAATVPGARPFYLFFCLLEMALTITVALVALRWPRTSDAA